MTTDAVAKAVDVIRAEVTKEAQLSPSERYQKRLEEAKLPLATARHIFDQVLTHGFYEETVVIGPVRATLRTRVYDDTLRLQRALEMEKPQLMMSQEELVTRYNLAASLYVWNGKPVPHDTDADFEKALKLVRGMPSPLFSVVARELFKFDQKIMLAFSEGAVESFS